MQTLNRILVPVDFSASSRAALEYAALIGGRFGSEVDVLHVWLPPSEVDSRTQMLAVFARSDAGQKMRECLATVEEHGDIAAHGRLVLGAHRDVPDAIVEMVKSEDYDLVVIGAHDHEGLPYLLRSGVAEKVVRHAPCPVVTVHAPEEPPAADLAAEADGDAVWVRPS